MREAAIDIGTNTMLLLVAEVRPEAGPTPRAREIVKVLAEDIQYPRLGEGVHSSRRFSEEAMLRAREAFARYRARCGELGVRKIHAVATSASRDAENSKSFFREIEKEFGIEVSVISGDSEARLTFFGGLLPSSDPRKCAVLDIGGGSTEFVAFSGSELGGQSVDMGCVRATELYLRGDPYTKESLAELVAALRKEWKTIGPDLVESLKQKEWIGVAGTPTTLAAMDSGLVSFMGSKVDGYRLSRRRASHWFESLVAQTNAQRRSQPLLGPGRADIIVAGAAILLTAMEEFGRDSMVVSSRGLRHGVLLHPDFL